MKYQINPILIEIAKNFKAAHTSEPDSVEAIALMIALNWRTNMEPNLPTMAGLTGSLFDMPEKLARKIHPFLITQGYLLGQLTNDSDFFGGDYSEVVKMVNEVNADYTLKSNPLGNGMDDWEWEGYSWPQFTFVGYSTTYQAINKKKLFRV